jgi:hypothetical protein
MHVPLETFYYLCMLKAVTALRVKGDPTKVAEMNRVPAQISKFLRTQRAWSSSITKELFGRAPAEFLRNMRAHHRFLETERGERLVSPKLVRVAEYIATRPGKQYAYTVSPNHTVLAKALETWHGMRNVTGELLGELEKQRRVIAALKASGGKNVLVIKKSSGRRNFIVLNDKVPECHRQALVDIFNSAANINGDYIRTVVATDQLYEGLDLRGLEHVNLVDPLPSPLQEMQAIGRGPRFCSHRGLPVARRVVHVLRWFATAPKGSTWPKLEESLAHMKGARGQGGDPALVRREYERLGGRAYDEFVFRESRGDAGYMVLSNFERIMRSASLDCAVLSKYHPDVNCSVPRLSRSVTISAGAACG